MFRLFESDDPLLLEIQNSMRELAHSSGPIVAAKHSVVDLYEKTTWAKELLSYQGTYLSLINHNVRAGNVLGDIPENYLIPYPIKEWVLQLNYTVYGDKEPVAAHYDTPDYVCVCLLEDFPMGFGGELCTKDKEISLSKAGECVVINGSKVLHWVNQSRNPDLIRKTLVISLIDDRCRVVVDHMKTIKKATIKDWLEWHDRQETMTAKEMVKTLISKL